MSETAPPAAQRSYGCSFGCGNPYDYIIISVADSSTEMLCLPCYVRLARDMLAAVLDPSNPDVLAALSVINDAPDATVPGPSARSRGHNAPVGTEDPDLLSAWDSVITTDDLPDDFR